MKVLIWFLLFLMFLIYAFIGSSVFAESREKHYTLLSIFGLSFFGVGLFMGVLFIIVSIKLIWIYFS